MSHIGHYISLKERNGSYKYLYLTLYMSKEKYSYILI